MQLASKRGRLEILAKAAKLKLANAEALTLRRQRCGRGFIYFDATGGRVRDLATIQRIRALAIPPAYRDVRIAPDARMHLQAFGMDAAGRMQHRYHPAWANVREGLKVRRLSTLIAALPRLRAAVVQDLALQMPSIDLAAAVAVAIVDENLLRVGCEAYVREKGGRGVATLLKRHVTHHEDRMEIRFFGKGGKEVTCTLDNAAAAKAMRLLLDLPGRRLLQYRSEDTSIHRLAAQDINRYLREKSGAEISAKDLRMLGASAAAVEHFVKVEPAEKPAKRKRQLSRVMKLVAAQLSNTPAVARESYVHQAVVSGFENGTLARVHKRTRGGFHIRRAEKTLASLARGWKAEAPSG